MSNDIASLVGSRICHDLISPIGAISNGVELMGMTQSTDGAELGLINDSVLSANAKIRFFRVAYGNAAPEQRMARSEILSILSDQSRGGRLTYHWNIDEDIRRREARGMFLLIQCCESAMPRGGDLTVEADGQTWIVRARGPLLRWDAPLWDSLTNPFSTIDHTAALVQFALLPQVLQDIGRKVEVMATEDEICARVSLIRG